MVAAGAATSLELALIPGGVAVLIGAVLIADDWHDRWWLPVRDLLD